MAEEPSLPSHIGRYRVCDEAGRGGFASVLRGFDEELESYVAIKVLLSEYAVAAGGAQTRGGEIEQRFVDEARLLRRIRSPHVVTVHDVGRLEHGRPYFVMDFADRGTLAKRLGGDRGAAVRAGADLPRALLALVDAIADGLGSLHAAGVVHRDIKPANVLLQHARRSVSAGDPGRPGSAGDACLVGLDERILIGDLGIAKDLITRSESNTVVGGTPLYRAPEQEREDYEVTPMADVYSATAMLWYVLTGEPPPVVSFMMRSIARLSSAWRVVIARGMAFDPAARYPSMDAWRTGVGEALADDGLGRAAVVSSVNPTRVATSSLAARPDDSVPGETECPYKGLAAYQPEDAELFRGREELIDEVVSRLKQQRVLAIGGPSGSGKSSLVRAGLVPALHAGALSGTQAWRVVLFTPGRDPLAELHFQVAVAGHAASGDTSAPSLDELSARPTLARHLIATAGDKTRLALVIDQFEELFTMTPPAQRGPFLDALSAMTDPADSQVRLVLVVRADFYGECARFAWLAARLSENQLLVGPMSPSELRRAISEPARDAGLMLEPALVDEVLEQASGQAGSLPLLSYALAQTWERRDGRTLTLAGYHATGGMAGAIAQAAETLYTERFDTDEREAAHRLLLRLVTPGDGTPDTRRVIARHELVDDPAPTALANVTERLTDARLLSIDERSLQIAHEALLHSWPRLAEWIEASREALRARQRIARAAAAWAGAENDQDLLYRGTPLAAAEDWAEANPSSVEAGTRQFIEASVAGRQAELARVHEAGRRQRRVRRLAVAALAVLAISASLASLVAFSAWRDAQRSERAAQQSEREAVRSEQRAIAAGTQAQQRFAGALGTTAYGLGGAEPLLSLSLAAESVARSEGDASGFDARAALVRARQALARDEPTLTAAPIPAGDALSLAMSPSGSLVASGLRDGGIVVIDTRTGKRLSPVLHGHHGGVQSLDFSPDGRWLASGGTDGSVRAWLVADGMLGSGRQLGDAGGVAWSVRYSPDGRRLAVASQDGTVRLWRVSGEGPAVEDAVFRRQGDFLSVAFSPDGRALLAGTGVGTIYGWSLADSEPLFEPLTGVHTSDVWDIAFDADGTRFATSSSDGSTAVLDYPSGELLARPFDGTQPTAGVAFDAKGAMYVGAAGGELKIWRGRNSRDPSRATAAGHELPISKVRLSRVGDLIATLGNDQIIRLWRNGPGLPMAVRYGGGKVPQRGVAIAPDGKRLVAGRRDGVVSVISLAAETMPLTLRGHEAGVWAVAVSPDGKTIATGDRAGVLRTWRADDGTPGLVLTAHSDAIWWLAFTAAGDRLVSAGDTGVRISRADDGELLGELKAEQMELDGGRITRGALSSDDALIVLSSTTGRVGVVELGSMTVRKVIEVDDDVIWSAAFDAAGTEVASASSDEVVSIWNIESGTRRVTMTGHTGGATDLRYLADGVTLAVTDRRGHVHLWDTRSGRRLGPAFVGHRGAVWRIAVHPDGRRFATAGDDGVLRVWDLLSLDRACEIGARAFDATRREHYLGVGAKALACGEDG